MLCPIVTIDVQYWDVVFVLPPPHCLILIGDVHLRARHQGSIQEIVAIQSICMSSHSWILVKHTDSRECGSSSATVRKTSFTLSQSVHPSLVNRRTTGAQFYNEAGKGGVAIHQCSRAPPSPPRCRSRSRSLSYSPARSHTPPLALPLCLARSVVFQISLSLSHTSGASASAGCHTSVAW